MARYINIVASTFSGHQSKLGLVWCEKGEPYNCQSNLVKRALLDDEILQHKEKDGPQNCWL